VLLARKDAARALLESVDADKVPAAMLSVEQVRQVELHHDPQIDALVRKHWGQPQRRPRRRRSWRTCAG
jgi:hypothetical protein